MMKPQITIHDVATNETIVREVTDVEYEIMLADGWVAEGNTPEEWNAE